MYVQLSCLTTFLIPVIGIITSFPSDPVVCYGGVSTLYCGSNRSDITILSWSVLANGSTLSTSKLEAIGIHTENNIIIEDSATAVITIPGSDDTNGVSIRCTATRNSFDFGYKATPFTVTDIPDVTDLDVQFNNSVMIATWTAPSCLPVNYCYHVTVSNDTMTITTTNTTSTQYQMLAVSSCVNYTISVTVMDTGPGGYESGTTNVTGESPFTEDIIIADFLKTNLSVTFNDVNECVIIIPFKLQSNVSICSEVTLVFIEEIMLSTGTHNTTTTLITLGPHYTTTTGIVDYTVGPLVERFKANLTILLMNETELCVEISTFNVQKFRIKEINDTVLLTCVFADNSHADGCVVHFIQNDTVTIEHFIPKQVNEDIASTDVIIPNGDYTVLVYDDVINGQPISISPAYTTRYTVTHVIIPSSTPTATSISTRSTADTSSGGSIIPTAESELPKNNYITIAIAVSAIISVVLIVMCAIIVVALVALRRKRQQSKRTVELHGEQATVQKTRAQQHIYEDSPSVKLTNTVIPPDTSNEQHSDDDDFEYHVPHHVSVRDTLTVQHSTTTDKSTSSLYVITLESASFMDEKSHIVTSPANATPVVYAELDRNTHNRQFTRVSDDTKCVYDGIIGTTKIDAQGTEAIRPIEDAETFYPFFEIKDSEKESRLSISCCRTPTDVSHECGRPARHVFIHTKFSDFNHSLEDLKFNNAVQEEVEAENTPISRLN